MIYIFVHMMVLYPSMMILVERLYRLIVIGWGFCLLFVIVRNVCRCEEDLQDLGLMDGMG